MAKNISNVRAAQRRVEKELRSLFGDATASEFAASLARAVLDGENIEDAVHQCLAATGLRNETYLHLKVAIAWFDLESPDL